MTVFEVALKGILRRRRAFIVHPVLQYRFRLVKNARKDFVGFARRVSGPALGVINIAHNHFTLECIRVAVNLRNPIIRVPILA